MEDERAGGDGISSCRDLRVCQDAMALAEECYAFTRAFLREEMFGMTSPIRRAAASVAANIAEGQGPENTGSFVQFFRMGQGSLKELETDVILSARVGLAPQPAADALFSRCESVGKAGARSDPVVAAKGSGSAFMTSRHSPFAIGHSPCGGAAR